MLLKTSVLLLLTVAGAAQALNVWTSNDMLDDLNATNRPTTSRRHRERSSRYYETPVLPRKM